MPVTRADKEAEQAELAAAFKSSDSAVLVDYRGLNVPQVTELRRQLRSAKASYRVVKNTIAQARPERHVAERAGKHFEGATAVAYTSTDPVALAKTLTTFVKTAPALKIKAAVVQGKAIQPAGSERPGVVAGQTGAARQAALRPAGADGADRQRAERRAARLDERAGAGEKKRSET